MASNNSGIPWPEASINLGPSVQHDLQKKIHYILCFSYIAQCQFGNGVSNLPSPKQQGFCSKINCNQMKLCLL